MVGSTLEDLVAGAVVTGIDPAGPVTVVTAQWHGTRAVTLVYRDHAAQVREQIVFRSDEGSSWHRSILHSRDGASMDPGAVHASGSTSSSPRSTPSAWSTSSCMK